MDGSILIAEEGPQANEENGIKSCFKITSTSSCFRRILYLLELSLYLPRRLTIPEVLEERWSKPYVVASAAFAQVLLALIWDSKRKENAIKERMAIHLCGGFIGMTFGVAAFFKTNKERPPTKFPMPMACGWLPYECSLGLYHCYRVGFFSGL